MTTTEPHWMTQARRRHENKLVLQYIDHGHTDADEISDKSGIGRFKVRLILRRLLDAGLLVEVD